jgi:hypothetical protein
MKNLILILSILILSTSCRSVKKKWVSENFATKIETALLEGKLEQSQQLETQKTIDSFSQLLKSNSTTKTETNTSSNNESTTISGTITAQEGKTKTVSFGNTKIESDGANITFTSTNTKAQLRETQETISQLEQKFESITSHNTLLYKETQSALSQITILKQEVKSLKESKSKDLKKTGFPWWIVIAIGIILSVYIIYKNYFSKFTL